MKDRKASVSHEPIALVVLLPNEDHRTYTEARRILRCLMRRNVPSIETLILHDLHGRDAEGIADNYLDAIRWPLERGRAVSVRLRNQARREDRRTRKPRRAPVRYAKPPADPARN